MNVRDCFDSLASLCLVAVCVTIVLLPETAVGLSKDLSFALSLNQKTYQPGEPVLATVRVSNAGGTTQTVDFGWNGYGALSMSINNASGKAVASGEPIKPRAGLARIGARTVSPESEISSSFVVNRWCSTILPPGLYRLDLVLDQGANDIVRLSHEFSIEAKDQERLKGRVDSLAQTVFDDKKSDQFSKSEAIELLAFAETLDHKEKVLKAYGSFSHVGIETVQLVARLDGTEGAKLLMKVSEDEKSNMVVRNLSKSYIFKLRKNGSQALLQATAEYAKRNPSSDIVGEVAD
jgi:hypothetical protein